MSAKQPRKPRVKKAAAEEEPSIDFMPPEPLVDVSAPVRRGRPSTNNNEVVKSRLSLIIDMLDIEEVDDERTLKKNVSIAIRHLKEVKDML